MEIYKWKWIVLGTLECLNNTDLGGRGKVNDNIVLDVFIICHKLRHVYIRSIDIRNSRKFKLIKKGIKKPDCSI